jgi:hypothetical protein
MQISISSDNSDRKVTLMERCDVPRRGGISKQAMRAARVVAPRRRLSLTPAENRRHESQPLKASQVPRAPRNLTQNIMRKVTNRVRKQVTFGAENNEWAFQIDEFGSFLKRSPSSA